MDIDGEKTCVHFSEVDSRVYHTVTYTHTAEKDLSLLV